MRGPHPLLRYALVALLSFGAGVTVTGALAQQQPQAPEAPDLAAEDALMKRFIGRWEGEGEARGKGVLKEQRSDWVLGRRFIYIRSRSTGGDRFESEAYLRFNPSDRKYELYEFNNGPYPVTTWTGQRKDDRLVLEGKVAGKTLRATYLWLDKDRMQILLSDEKGEAVKAYAGGTYRRIRTRGEERDL